MKLKNTLEIICLALLLSICSSSLLAQQGRVQSLPSERYYNAFPDYYRGEYARALRGFESGATTAFRDGRGRFLDSICYWTMAGECYYQMGDYATAIENYENALRLYVSFREWPRRTVFPSSISPNATAVSRAGITWGTSTRTTTIGNFSNQMNVMLGDPQAVERARGVGGVVDEARLRPVDVKEVLRCTALAAYRRNHIKGVTCKHDPFTRQLLSSLGSVRPDGTTSGSWRGVLAGLAQSSAGQSDKAVATLTSSLQIGRYDHPLTAIALLELGNIAKSKQDWKTALTMYAEASFSGAVFGQYDVIGDAMHNATVIQMITDQQNVFEPLAPAAQWANRERARALHASLIGDAIWSTAESGASADALSFISKNIRALRNGDLRQSRIGAQWIYCSALARSMEGDVKGSQEALEEFLVAARNSSLWLYQLNLADQLVVNSQVNARTADVLYSELLRDPSNEDWQFEPMESIAFLISPHVDSLTNWFRILISLKLETRAIEVADMVRRHRFFSTLPLGGRQLSLRWLTSAPLEALDETARQQQADLLARYPAIKELKVRSDAIVAELRKLPIVPERSSDEIKQQTKLLKELQQVSTLTELTLQSISLRREPSALVFPPQRMLTEVQDRLADNQMIISTFNAHDQYYVNIITSTVYSQEAIFSADDLAKDMTKLFEEIGLGEKSGATTVDVLQSDDWRTVANQISAKLFPRTDPTVFDGVTEVTVVPDGILWYFPFELIQIGTSEESVNLADKMDIRYAPTLGTAVADDRTPRRFGKSLVVAGRTNARDDQELAEGSFETLKSEMGGAEMITKSNKVPSNLLSSLVDQIVVWSEIDAADETNTSISPMQFDAGRTGSALGSWLQLPWTDIDQAVLPGFKSAGSGGKSVNSNGEELFLMSCTMLATGTKSLLISRWPVGGQTTMEFTRQFAVESGNRTPSEALRRSIQLVQQTEIDLKLEPRIRDKKMDLPLKGEHPLFWASYMLMDLTTHAAEPEDDGEPEDGSSPTDDDK